MHKSVIAPPITLSPTPNTIPILKQHPTDKVHHARHQTSHHSHYHPNPHSANYSVLTSPQAVIVRMAAIGGLTKLFEDPSNIASLHDFVSRFERRCLELVEDVDERIAVKAVSRTT